MATTFAGSNSMRFLVIWGYLKSLVYHGGVTILNDLNNSKTLHVRSLTTDQLRFATEHNVDLKFCWWMRVITWSTFPYIILDTIHNYSSSAISS
ncbi:hypothetical protein TNCV_4149941 [Trichonephila clavipes]|uniref:Uncharacterized protein n=1 Tax=Trichonephila clavipes TaxID=2585209 RepID=A0A8X7BEQ0_TRICX|nr:hypothetical protein TNCV_4149941 [Trichonephila clavipes]